MGAFRSGGAGGRPPAPGGRRDRTQGPRRGRLLPEVATMHDVLVLAAWFALVLLGVIVYEVGYWKATARAQRALEDATGIREGELEGPDAPAFEELLRTCREEAGRTRRRLARAEVTGRHLGDVAARAEPLIGKGLSCRQIASRLGVDQGLLRRAVPTLPGPAGISPDKDAAEVE